MPDLQRVRRDQPPSWYVGGLENWQSLWDDVRESSAVAGHDDPCEVPGLGAVQLARVMAVAGSRTVRLYGRPFVVHETLGQARHTRHVWPEAWCAFGRGAETIPLSELRPCPPCRGGE